MLDAYADRWALITGASSGIGAEFARRLSAHGMHLVLTARRKELLDKLADELHTRHGTKTEIIVGDLTDSAEPQRLCESIAAKGIQIELLVNNAGFGWVGTIDETEQSRMRDLVQLNVASMTELTYRILPGMMERGHGGIINVSSVAGFQPVAYMPTYSASKAFVLHFSEALWAECRDRGVTVTALCPGTTQTDFFDVANVPGWLKKHDFSTPEQVVKAAIKALERRKQFVIPGFKNWLITFGVRIARRKMVVLQSMKFFRPRKKDDSSHDSSSKIDKK
ncbi:MAG: SDR family oxidoreductase [Planctomycetes bacterium]|nr:SDR family oxidoreductase [Planctomycetota bacterium]